MGTPAIKVESLEKKFSILQKRPGFWAAVKSFFLPEYKYKTAVDDISFEVEKGDCVAFIGPNGAGKSTTIKIITGILHSTAGTVSILGLDPVNDRMQLAFKIGTVFGQKSQLWYHLPPLDTFAMLSHIYELKPAEFKARLDFLVKKFEIEHVLKTPVRKLSLGERMRCELVGSLLHRPQILFLDEPTIGLDVIAKQQMRDLLEYLNKQEGVTIFLTSHDVGDIERLARRTIIVNHGKIVFDDVTEKLKKAISASKVIDLVLEENTEKFYFFAGKILEKTSHSVKIQIDASASSTQQLLDYAFENFSVVDITIHDTPLEEIITKIYQGGL
ncbi:MAG: ABC transporter [candidate division TM6 bacterium GW2011_GWF2_32_72]|nr:MAG: ABC transporter [candidate division TM6 bacterium GW2011_GWF2_32_72]